MEEEGDVVYFESSPELQLMKDIDIDVSDSVHYTSTSHDATRPNTVNSNSSDMHELNETSDRFSLNEPHKQQFSGSQSKMIQLIQSSSLLTEDDYELLTFVLKTDSCSGLNSATSYSTSDNLFITLVVLSIVMLLALWVWQRIVFGLLQFTITSFVGLIIMTIMLILRNRKPHDNHVTCYLRECEKFLSLVTLSIRTIQEREMAYHGFNRPSAGVPINRLERNAVQYQCTALRIRLFTLCQKGVKQMRTFVQQLVEEHPISPELDIPLCYMSFTELSELHDHLGDDMVGIKRSSIDKPPQLSLQSLKSAANIFAITNSELLKRMALLLKFSNGSATPLNKDLTKAITVMSDFFLEEQTQLNWSLQYHKQPLVIEDKKTTPNDSTHLDVTPFMDLELHSSDMQILTALNKLRELKIDVSSDKDLHRSEDEIDSILNNLFLAERHLKNMLSHLMDKRISKTCHTNTSPKECNTIESKPLHESLDCTLSSSSDDEEERVYEALVTIAEESFTQECTTGEDEFSKDQRDASINMLHELNSVLAVRRAEKQKKMRQKQDRKKLLYSKHEEEPSPMAETDTHSTNIGTNPLQTMTHSTGKGTSPLQTMTHSTGIETSPLQNAKTDTHSIGMGLRSLQNEDTGNSKISNANIGIEPSRMDVWTENTPANVGIEPNRMDIWTEITPELGGTNGINLIALAAASKAKIRKEEIIEDSD